MDSATSARSSAKSRSIKNKPGLRVRWGALIFIPLSFDKSTEILRLASSMGQDTTLWSESTEENEE